MLGDTPGLASRSEGAGVPECLFVHEESKRPSNVPLLPLGVVIPNHLPATQQLEENAGSGVEAHQPGPETSGEKVVQRPETGNKVVQRAREKTGIPTDAAARAHAAKNKESLPTAGDNAAPSSTLRSDDAAGDIAGLQNPCVVRRVVVPAGPDEGQVRSEE